MELSGSQPADWELFFIVPSFLHFHRHHHHDPLLLPSHTHPLSQEPASVCLYLALDLTLVGLQDAVRIAREFKVSFFLIM